MVNSLLLNEKFVVKLFFILKINIIIRIIQWTHPQERYAKCRKTKLNDPYFKRKYPRLKILNF